MSAVVGYDKDGPLFDGVVISRHVATDMTTGDHMQKRVRHNMTPDFKLATEVAGEAQKLFMAASGKLVSEVQRLTETSKATSSSIRKTANELHESMQRIEKLANVDRLERQVMLLERAAKALESLAELERGGHLTKIAGALK